MALVGFGGPIIGDPALSLDNFVVDDANEFHAGLEYVIVSKYPVAIRGGLWHDPDHQMRFEDPSETVHPLNPARPQSAFSGRRR